MLAAATLLYRLVLLLPIDGRPFAFFSPTTFPPPSPPAPCTLPLHAYMLYYTVMVRRLRPVQPLPCSSCPVNRQHLSLAYNRQRALIARKFALTGETRRTTRDSPVSRSSSAARLRNDRSLPRHCSTQSACSSGASLHLADSLGCASFPTPLCKNLRCSRR